MPIELIFRGELLPGGSRERAIAVLADRFKQTPEAVERRLFTGRPVRLKTVAGDEEAARWVASFARAGAHLETRPVPAAAGAEPPATGPADAGRPAASARSPRRPKPLSPVRHPRVGELAQPGEPRAARRARRSAGRIVAGTVAAALTAAVGLAAWYTAPVWRGGDTSEAERSAAQALADEDLLALGHLDVTRAVELQGLMRGGPFGEPFGEPDPVPLPAADGDLLDSLVQAGLDPRQRVQDVLIGAYGRRHPGTFAVALLGDFDPAAIRSWLEARYQVERVDAPADTVRFSWLDTRTCQPARPLALRLSEHRLLLAPPERLDHFWQRLEAAAPAAVPLERWQALAGSQILTLGVFAPGEMGSAADGVPGRMLATAAHATEPASGLYLGAAPALVPPGLLLVGSIESGDERFIRDSHAAAETWLRDARSKARDELPELLDLYQRVAFRAGDGAVEATLELDTDFDDELETLIASIVAEAFQLTPPSLPGNGTVADEVEENPAQFADASPGELAPYSNFGDGFFTPQWQDGPFALAVSELAAAGDGGVGVTLRGEGRGLPNLASRSKPARLRITDVMDHEGRSLLPAETCAGQGQRGWTEFGGVSRSVHFQDGEAVHYPTVALQKKLTLPPGIGAGQVAAIRGEIEYLLPARVQRFRVEQPLGGKVVEAPGVRLRFQPAPPERLGYEVSGDVRRVLAVRGLNAGGQVLATGGALWGERWFGAGETASVDLRGRAAAAEVVLAETLEPLRYRFELTGAYPPVGGNERLTPPAPLPPTPVQLSKGLELPSPDVPFQWQKPLQTAAAGPALLALQRMQSSGFAGLVTQLDVYLTDQIPLLGQLNGATLRLDRAILADGSDVALDVATPLTFDRDGGYWSNGEYHPDPERPWQKGAASLQAQPYEQAEPAALEGRLVLRANHATETLRLSAEPGTHAQQAGIDVTVVQWAENALVLEVGDGAERLVSVAALAGDETIVGHARDVYDYGGGTRVRVALGGRPEVIQLTVASDTAEHELPFRLALAE